VTQTAVQQIGVIALRSFTGEFLPAEPLYIRADTPNINALKIVENFAKQGLAGIIFEKQNEKGVVKNEIGKEK